MLLDYIIGVIGQTWWQLFQLFAVSSVLAIALQWVEDGIRRKGVSRFGPAYWYFVALGGVMGASRCSFSNAMALQTTCPDVHGIDVGRGVMCNYTPSDGHTVPLAKLGLWRLQRFK